MEYYKNLSLENIVYRNDNGIECVERWKDIPDYEGYYQVSDLGRVKVLSRIVKTGLKNGGFRKCKEFIRKQSFNKANYLLIGLRKEGNSEKKIVHRLVAKAFIPNPENKPEVNHKIDNSKIVNKQDNRFYMLEWNTGKENIQNALKDGLIALGEKNYCSKLKNKDILDIRDSILSHAKLAIIYNVSRSNISKIINRKKWKHI